MFHPVDEDIVMEHESHRTDVHTVRPARSDQRGSSDGFEPSVNLVRLVQALGLDSYYLLR